MQRTITTKVMNVDIGKSFSSALVSIGPIFSFNKKIDQPVDPGSIQKLTIPFYDPSNTKVMSLLSWHAHMSEHLGRDKEMTELKEWAEADRHVSIKFITGPGGMGKSRLAAEFALSLKNKGWEAGFVGLRDSITFQAGKKGTLVIIDYPEENREKALQLLENAAAHTDKGRLRILFLTRQSLAEWWDSIDSRKTAYFVDGSNVDLESVDNESAYLIYCSALNNIRERIHINPVDIEKEAFIGWLEQSDELKRPLFIIALALYNSIHPEDKNSLTYTITEIMNSIIDREILHLHNIEKELWGKEYDFLPCLIAMAAVADGLSIESVENMRNIPAPALSRLLPETDDFAKDLQNTDIVMNGSIPKPAPDILAAAFTVKVFSEVGILDKELFWHAFSQNLPGTIERLTRLCHDAEEVLKLDYHLDAVLFSSVNGDTERIQVVQECFDLPIPLRYREGLLTVTTLLLEKATDDEERAFLLNNISCFLDAVGDTEGALKASEESVELYRRLSKIFPGKFEPHLAASLNNLSTKLNDVGDMQGALKAGEEALELYRRLSNKYPDNFEKDLAMSLNNLSCRLYTVGNREGALKAIEQAVELYRRLSKKYPDKFEKDLAANLNNLSCYLDDVGNAKGALKAVEESVEIRRRLSKKFPEKFESDLAMSLNNLSCCLDAVGDAKEALVAIEEAVEIRRRLSKKFPEKFLPDLAISLNELSLRLGAMGDTEGALKAVEEAVELHRRLVNTFPDKIEPDLAMSLNNLSGCLGAVGNSEGALEAIKEAVEIRRRLAKKFPEKFEPDLARSLGTQGRILRASAKKEEAMKLFQEGAAIVRPYAEQWPDGPAARLLASLTEEIQRTPLG